MCATYSGIEKSNKAHQLFGSHILSLITLNLNLRIPILIMSHIQSGVVAPLHCSSSRPPSSHILSPVELSKSGSESDGDNEIVGLTRELDGMEDSNVLDPEEEEELEEGEEEEEDLEEGEEEEEEDMDNFIDTSRLELNANNNICRWKEL